VVIGAGSAAEVAKVFGAAGVTDFDVCVAVKLGNFREGDA